MSKSLPECPNLEQLKHRAKDLLDAQKRGDASVCAVLRHVKRLSRLSDDEILHSTVSLQEVQHALAREYGFRSWKALKDCVAEKAVDRLMSEAVEVFTAKGPAHNSTRSEWDNARWAEVERLKGAGEEGFRVADRMASSANGRLRLAAAWYFNGSTDPRAREYLERFLHDESARVRIFALRAYAWRIHPSPPLEPVWGLGLAKVTQAVPDGVEALVEMLDDESWRIKKEAVFALAAYAKLEDSRVVTALTKALQDPEHPVHHAAARALEVRCPGCGEEPTSLEDTE